MDMGTELEYIISFAKERDFEDKDEREQLRALWTAYCLHQNIDFDTFGYDMDIGCVWDAVVEGNNNLDKEAFMMYMCEYLC